MESITSTSVCKCSHIVSMSVKNTNLNSACLIQSVYHNSSQSHYYNLIFLCGLSLLCSSTIPNAQWLCSVLQKATSVKCCAGSKKPNCQFAERKGTQRVVCQIQRSSYKSWHTKPGREPRRTFFHFVCLANANTPASAVQAWTDQETIK